MDNNNNNSDNKNMNNNDSNRSEVLKPYVRSTSLHDQSTYTTTVTTATAITTTNSNNVSSPSFKSYSRSKSLNETVTPTFYEGRKVLTTQGSNVTTALYSRQPSASSISTSSS